MDFDQFFDSISNKQMTIDLSNRRDISRSLLSNEALFQLPLIALVILVLAKDRKKPKISEIGRVVGECLEKSVYGFKGFAHNLGWSANLRVRTVTAVRFLELANLISIDIRNNSRISATELGKKVVLRAFSFGPDLQLCIESISRAYRNISIERQLEMELL